LFRWPLIPIKLIIHLVWTLIPPNSNKTHVWCYMGFYFHKIHNSFHVNPYSSKAHSSLRTCLYFAQGHIKGFTEHKILLWFFFPFDIWWLSWFFKRKKLGKQWKRNTLGNILSNHKCSKIKMCFYVNGRDHDNWWKGRLSQMEWIKRFNTCPLCIKNIFE
jgi:hypothetical protein